MQQISRRVYLSGNIASWIVFLFFLDELFAWGGGARATRVTDEAASLLTARYAGGNRCGAHRMTLRLNEP